MDSLKDIENISWWENVLHKLRDDVLVFGQHLLLCIIIYFVGRKLIAYIKVLANKLLSKQNFDPSVVSFLKSLIDVVLTAALLIAIVNILGINNSSFVAILASAGVAMGMAMSGTLQNFAGGVMILVFRPYRIGDFIQAQGQEGFVKEIRIFNTEITTIDNKTVFIPNGGLSSNVIVNHSNKTTRRIDLVIGVEYGTDYDFAKSTMLDIFRSEERILPDPPPFVALKALNESSVDILIRVWVKTPDYWDVYFDINEQIYKVFGKKGIEIPFPQMTVHVADDTFRLSKK
jgi:small conductance mechanosensitive channel